MISDTQKDSLIKFGSHLEMLRKRKNLTFRKLALNCDIDYSDLRKYEKGSKNMTFLTLLELAKGLGVTLKELMDY